MATLAHTLKVLQTGMDSRMTVDSTGKRFEGEVWLEEGSIVLSATKGAVSITVCCSACTRLT